MLSCTDCCFKLPLILPLNSEPARHTRAVRVVLVYEGGNGAVLRQDARQRHRLHELDHAAVRRRRQHPGIPQQDTHDAASARSSSPGGHPQDRQVTFVFCILARQQQGL